MHTIPVSINMYIVYKWCIYALLWTAFMYTSSTGKMLRTLNVLSFFNIPQTQWGRHIIVLLFIEKEIENLNSLPFYIVSTRGASFYTKIYYRPSNCRTLVLDHVFILLICQLVEQYVMTILLKAFLCKIIDIDT